MNRRERGKSLLAHAMMLACVVAFLFPFVWMIATSLKTDEELEGAGGFWPALPRFVASSSIELRGLQLRTLDAHIYNLAENWTVESGNAKLESGKLSYHFPSPDAAPVVLRCDFDFPADPSLLHKLIFAIKPDDSWHRVSAALDLGGTHWVSDRTTWLAQARPFSIIFQPPTFDDETFQPRTWIPLRASGQS